MDRKNLTIELKALCREHLATYEVPSHFEFVKELPRSPLGKLLKSKFARGRWKSRCGTYPPGAQTEALPQQHHERREAGWDERQCQRQRQRT